MQKAAVAFDIGGTQVKTALVSEDGAILDKGSIDTPLDIDSSALLEKMKTRAVELKDKLDASKYELVGFGVGAPGLSSKDAVLVGGCQNAPAFNGMDFKEIGKAIGVRAKSDNDANTAALGEVRYGAGQGGYSTVMLATLGTGVGGGIVLEGKPFRGAFGYAGELGHICINTAGLACNCGSYGCLEQYASASAVVRRAIQKLRHELPTSLTFEKLEKEKAKAVFDAAREGDDIACEIIREVGHFLGIGFASAANLLNLDLILIGGGMSASADLLIPHIKSYMKNYTRILAYKNLEIRQAGLGNDAGVLGAAALIFMDEQ